MLLWFPWEIEVSLSNREKMKFRMLLGRTALNHGLLVDPAKSYLTKQS
ncbi:RimK/LysX family protein [Akkermansiaceae bacterium]|nr:RimK/LysX family protein [Akkermansiaceae bacterium]